MIKIEYCVTQSSTVCALFACALLGGCQGIEWGAESPTPSSEATPTPALEATPEGPTSTPEASASDVHTVTLDAGASSYFRLDGMEAVSPSAPETSVEWDIQFASTLLFLNGGESGSGNAWGLGPVGTGMDDYEALTDHSDVVGPVQYYDEFDSVLSDWYEYIVSGQTHGVYSRYHVYAIQVDEDHVYKLQILDYYDVVNGSPESGMVTFRWAPLDATAVNEFTLDARAGGSHAEPEDPANKYTYFNLQTGAVIDITDAESETSTAWDIAFKRYYVKLNGGVSGPKGVLGYDFQAERVETTAEITSFTPESELPLFEGASEEDISGAWVEDRIGSILQGSYTQSASGVLEPSGAVYVVTDAAGKSYYKFLVTDLLLSAEGIPAEVTFRAAEID